MRKHASSWGIKAILAMIILSFVLFFGYSKISKLKQATTRLGKDQARVATVNHMAVPDSEYRFYYENALERVRAQSEGKPIPEFMEKMIQQTTLSQLVQRELLLQLADKIGLHVTDEQLAEAVQRSQVLIRGQFDPSFYRQQYLPYFENRFGINFEDKLRNDLRAEEVQMLFTAPVAKQKKDGEKEVPAEKITAWTFEVVTLNPDKMIENKIISSKLEAEDIAKQFISNASKSQWASMASKYKVDLEKVQSVSIKDRRAKLKGMGLEDYKAVFALTEKDPVVESPITRSDGKIAIVRLEAIQEVEEKNPASDDEGFFQKWMMSFAKNSEIQTFLDDQPQN